MSGFNQNIKSYFYFSKSQRKGLIFLFSLLLLLITAYFALPYFVKPILFSDDNFKTEVEKFAASEVKDTASKPLTPYPFDPNTISKTNLLDLGLDEHQAEMIVKYRNAGGKFYSREDFSRIYSISEDDFLTLEPYITIHQPQNISKTYETHLKPLSPFPFNPNQADSNKLSALGLSKTQVSNILKYRNAGGVFTIKSDFKKIYSIGGDDFAVLEKYILLPAYDSVALTSSPKASQKREMVEINSADTAELEKLYGIGKVFAGRIINYRDKLGGFYDKSQLLEVYGIDTSRYLKFADQIIVDPSKIRKIKINSIAFNALLQHPYLEYYLVKSIFNYKDAIGEFDSIDQLKEIDLMYDQLYNKLKPYLLVNTEEK